MALRDPRNKSRNNASRRTTSATRSTRSKTSAKYNPRPTSSKTRAETKGTSNKVTTGKGDKIRSSRLKQALDSVKTKRTPAKTPPKATAAGNARVVAEAFKKTLKQRVALDKLEKAKKGTKGTGVRTAKGSTPVKTNPPSRTPRGPEGPRTAPQHGPSQRVSGLQGSRTTPKPKPKAPPKAATPKVSNVGPQIRKTRVAEAANKARQARATRRAARTAAARRIPAKGAAVAGGLYTAGQMLRSIGKPGAAKMSRLGIGGNAPVSKSNQPKRKSSNVGNYNTRDADGTIRNRKRVGPKIVGPKKVGAKKVGTAEQAFDKAYAAAKKAGKKSFTFDGKNYSTK